jgi:hypothetical protein
MGAFKKQTKGFQRSEISTRIGVETWMRKLIFGTIPP